MIHKIQTLILFLSDDPEKFKYFSNSFYTHLNQQSSVQFIQDKKIENQIFLQIMKNENGSNFERITQENIQNLKNKIDNCQLVSANELSKNILATYEDIAKKQLIALSPQTHAAFYFWNAIAHLNHVRVFGLLEEFLHSVTLEQKNFYESQLKPDMHKKYLTVLHQLKLFQKTSFSFENNQTCSVFINGRKNQSNTLTLFSPAGTIINAWCEDGFYATQLTQNTTKSIKITPHINKSINRAPNLATLDLGVARDGKYQYVTMIYWSKKSQYLQAVIDTLPSLNQKHTLLLHLKAKQDLQSAGNKITEFISKHFQDLIESDTL